MLLLEYHYLGITSPYTGTLTLTVLPYNVQCFMSHPHRTPNNAINMVILYQSCELFVAGNNVET